jgi:hypothetical protein
MPKPTERLGATILAIVIVLAFVNFGRGSSDTPDPAPTSTSVVQVHGRVGNLKLPFFANPEVQRILRERYGLEVEVTGSGTNEIACPKDPALLDNMDFLWLGEQSQIPEYEKCQNRHDPWQNIFLSPMVIYSWTNSIDALVHEGVASQDSEGAYHLDMALLLDLLESNKTWKDIGIPHRDIQINVQATDPEVSSSGGTFAGLLSNTMNCLEVTDATTADTVLSSIFRYFQGLGYLEVSSKALFDSYWTKGEGARPMVALIESQISDYLYEYSQNHTQQEYALELQRVRDHVRMLYPEPTVWTSHPVVARTELGAKLMQALHDDEDLQRLGWEITGFRPALPGVSINISKSPVTGILSQIDSTIDLPGDAALAQIKKATKNDPGPGEPRRDCSDIIPQVSPVASMAAT